MENPVGLASVLGKWRDIHQHREAALLRLPESKNHDDVSKDSRYDVFAQTVDWLAHVCLEDREQNQQQMQEWMRKMETMVQQTDSINQAIEKQTQHLDTLLRVEFQKHEAWQVDKFSKIAILLSNIRGEEMPAMRSPGDATPVEPQSRVSSRDAKFADPNTVMQATASPQSNKDVRQQDPRRSTLEEVASPDPKQWDRGHSKMMQMIHNPSLLQRNIGSEKKRMQRYVKRAKELHRETSLRVKLIEFFGVSPKVIKAVKTLRKKPHNWMVNVVQSKQFAILSLTTVLLNGVWMGYQSEEEMHKFMHPERKVDTDYHEWVSRVFVILFTLELLLRMAAYGLYFFFDPFDNGWNIFDLIVVLTGICEAFFDTLNLNFLRILRVLRLARVTRVIRFLRFFQGLRYLLFMLVASGEMIYWSMVFLSFLIYIFAIIFMQGVNLYIDRDNLVLMRQVEVHYGSLSETMFTLMMAVTGGQPWEALLDPLYGVSDMMIPIFVTYIVISMFGVLNIVSAVFVEHARELKTRDREVAVEGQMRDSEAFGRELKYLYHKQGLHCVDDIMTREEFKILLASSDVQMFLQLHNIDVMDAEELFNLLDPNMHDKIGVDEFVFGCQRIKGHAKGMDVCLLYDQVLAVNMKITSLQDRTHDLSYKVTATTAKSSGELSAAMAYMQQISDELRAEVTDIRRLMEGKAMTLM